MPTKGRVFDRFRQFETLPSDRKALTKQAQSFLTEKSGCDRVTSAVLLNLLQKFLDSRNAVVSAQELADDLVCSGYFAVFCEEKDELTQLSGFGSLDDAVFVWTRRDDGVSVWTFRERAKQADYLTRMGKIIADVKGERVYVVVSESMMYMFASDTELEAKKSLSLTNASVQYESSVVNGILISNSDDFEVLAFCTKTELEEWLSVFIDAGATYREAHGEMEHVYSFYDLLDRDMQGSVVEMARYKGKTLLIVNVSSHCGLTAVNYFELVQLHEKYREHGLEILCFPCNQFAGQEPKSHEEIMDFVKQYNVQFPFFEKADVNGFHARPVFIYCKSRLPGVFGNFIKWNFTKFLIDRDGNACKRYAPRENPLSFENDIRKLLGMD